VAIRAIETAAAFGVARIDLTHVWRVDEGYITSPELAPAALERADVDSRDPRLIVMPGDNRRVAEKQSPRRRARWVVGVACLVDIAQARAYTRSMQDIAELAIEMRDRCPALRVRAASRMLARLYDEALREIGLEMSQLPVLAAVAISGERGLKVTEVALVLVMDRTSVTRAIRPLERLGLLRVARSPDDARSKVIVLTRAGERTLRDAYPRWKQTTRRIREVLGAARIDALGAELSALIAARPRLAPPSQRASRRPAREREILARP
jgi:DNA-binding MarR family transcriptional regulator